MREQARRSVRALCRGAQAGSGQSRRQSAPGAPQCKGANPLRRYWFLLGRLAFSTFFVLTALYLFLAYNSFTYEQVIRFELLPWLSRFARLHVWFYWPAQAALLATLRDELRDRARPAHRFSLGYA